MASNFRAMTDGQLIEYADNGLRGSGAVIEMLRRQQRRAMTVLLVALGIIAVIVGGVQAYLQWLELPAGPGRRRRRRPIASTPGTSTPGKRRIEGEADPLLVVTDGAHSRSTPGRRRPIGTHG